MTTGEEGLTEAKYGKGPTWLLLATIVAGVLCLVSLILSAAALAKNNPATVLVTPPPLPAPQQQENTNPKKIWLFAVGHDYGAHEYIDEEGLLQGFSSEIVNGVCQAGRLDCRLVVDRYSNCWITTPGEHPRGGVGLMGSWYDACVGWFKTVDRKNVFEFSLPYAKLPDVYFFTRVGSTFTGENLAGKKIGFISGWATDQKCLARQESIKNNTLPDESILHANTPDELMGWIQGGKVDAGFASWYTFGGQVRQGKLDYVRRESFHCFIHGNSIMTRKGSPLISIWNEAFTKFKDSNDFHSLCEQANKIHGSKGSIECAD